MCEKWTQHPPEHSGACGGKEQPRLFSHDLRVCMFNNKDFVVTDLNLAHEARDRSISEANFDSQRLTAFMRSASQVVFLFVHSSKNVAVVYILHEGCYGCSEGLFSLCVVTESRSWWSCWKRIELRENPGGS